MGKRTVEFDAHRTEKRPAEVQFIVANVPTKVSVHVRFKVEDKKK